MLARMQWYWQNIVWEPSMMLQYAVFSACMLILFFRPEKRRPWLPVLSFLAGYAGLMLVSMLYEGAAGSSIHANLVTHAIVILCAGCVMARSGVKARIITGVVFYTSELCLVSLAGAFSRFSGAGSLPAFWSDLLRNGFIVLTVLIAVYLRWSAIDRQGVIARNTVYLVAAYNAAFLVFTAAYATYSHSFNDYGYILAGAAFLCFLLVDLLGYRMICHICREYGTAIELRAKAVKNAGELSQLQISEARMEELRKLRHDLKNHFAYMSLLLQRKDYGALEAYFGDLQADLQKHTMVDCGNSTVSAVLNLELAKASVAGVVLDTKLAVPPVLPFRDSDLCSLLTNLIDNALEACGRLNISGAKIEVGICQRQEYLYICVTNPVGDADSRELLSLRTFKEDSIAHGYGSKIVDEIVGRYNGEINRSVDAHRFVVDLMLDLRFDRSGRDTE